MTPDIHVRIGLAVVASRLKLENIVADCTRERWSLIWEQGEMVFGSGTEHVQDVARILERYGDCIAVRHLPHSACWQIDRQDSVIKSLGQYSQIPVYNLGANLFNPTQSLADLMTIKANLKSFAGWKAALCWSYNPDLYPMAHANSFALATSKLGMDLTLACPQGYDLDPAILKLVQKNSKSSGANFEICRDLTKAVKGAHVVYVTSWPSIQHYDNRKQEKLLKQDLIHWSVSEETMEKTDGGYLMHPLPIKRNVSVVEQLLQGNSCLVYEQAENWMHAQRAIFLALMGA